MFRNICFLIVILVCQSCSDTMDIITEVGEEQVETVMEDRPNILLIIADDMGVDATPGYAIGAQKPTMPTLNSLMGDGLRFTNVWSNPVCSPTRATILTGKYGHNTGVLTVDHELSTTELSLQSYLNDQLGGLYDQAVIGKWHLSKDSAHPLNMGVPHYSGNIGGGLATYWDWRFTENNETSKSYDYVTTKYTDLAIDWIEETSKPWFLWLAYNAPHQPYHLPPTELHHQGALPDDDASIAANPRPYYFAMIEAMDSEIGRLLDSMDANTRENTIIIFVGDNGTPGDVVQDYNSKRAKGNLYQGGINVPMIISGKGVFRKNEVDESLINTTDLFSTIGNLAGVSTKEIYDSKSFVHILNGSESQRREFVFSEIGLSLEETDVAVRNATHKYMLLNNGDEFLFNLKDDPLETKNLLRINNLPLSTENSTQFESLKNKLESY